MLHTFSRRFSFSSIPRWATVDPFNLSAKNPHTIKNILDGKIVQSPKTIPIVDPMNGETFIHVSMAEGKELDNFA
jgi:hypothetical protein